jgi:rhamnogalacturonyl hydrolase YesR
LYLAGIGCLISFASTSIALTTESTARLIPVTDKAWAYSPVAPLAGAHQTLFTDGVYQYTAFYDAEGYLTLGKRRLGEDHWQLQKANHKASVKDAHDHISLVVDGEHYVHLAWDHHNNPLHYARGKAPGSLELEEPDSMVGSQEQSVTSPQFFRLPDGDLLFQYRDGGSANGRLVMNRYDTKNRRWLRTHNSLIDGQGKRSAYWNMALDKQGTLHLAWIWRDTPDLANNRDIAYARSDGGRSWVTINGKPLKLPITQASADYAIKIPPKSNLMSPPVIATDDDGHPFIASYWSPKPKAKPRYQVIYATEGHWEQMEGPEAEEHFSLNGQDTKHLPLSRPVLLVENGREDHKEHWVHLIYRNHFGQVVAATADKLEQPQWHERILIKEPMGAWEPNIDPVQWARLGQAHMLVQQLEQQEGDDKDTEPDQKASNTSALELLVWSSEWERHQAQPATGASPIPKNLTAPLRKKAIAKLATAAAEWQWQHLPEGEAYDPRAWTLAPFYLGNLAVARKIPHTGLQLRVSEQAERLDWQLEDHLYDAYDQCIMQTYLSLYAIFRDPRMLEQSKARLDYILEHPPTGEPDWGSPNARDRWSWSDALFMGPMSWLLMYELTMDRNYLDYMNKEWWVTSERLYRVQPGLFYRDESWLDLRETNGKTIHPARSNGWSFAGLAQLLEHLPKTHADYERYLLQYQQMAAALLKTQQADGLWRTGLLDPKTHSARETSGSSLIAYGLAWGLNKKLLDDKAYRPAITKAWNSLATSVTAEGKLENVQPIGAAPQGFDPHHSEPFGTGAFLLAASEVYVLAKH